jgi:hypothetical protein
MDFCVSKLRPKDILGPSSLVRTQIQGQTRGPSGSQAKPYPQEQGELSEAYKGGVPGMRCALGAEDPARLEPQLKRVQL